MCAPPTTGPMRSELRRRSRICARSCGRPRRRRWTRGRITRRCCGIWRGWAGESLSPPSSAAKKAKGPEACFGALEFQGIMIRGLRCQLAGASQFGSPQVYALAGLVEQVVDTDLNGVHADLAGIDAAKAAKVGRAAQPVMQVFDLGAPVRLKRVFDAGAGRPPTLPLTVRD